MYTVYLIRLCREPVLKLMMRISKDYHLMEIQNIYLDYLLSDLGVFSFLVLSQSHVSSDNSFMLLFCLLPLLKYAKIKNQKLKFFFIASFILPLPEVFFCIYCIVSLGILALLLRAVSSPCSGTDSATTCTNRNHITRCTASKIKPLEPVNISSHFFATTV